MLPSRAIHVEVVKKHPHCTVTRVLIGATLDTFVDIELIIELVAHDP